MPYKDTELKKEYQKRTATPYMKEWREKNREKHREYMRQWIKKRRLDVEKKNRDKQAPGTIVQRELNVAKWRGRVVSLDDIYIVGLLTRKNSIPKDAITPEIIRIHKRQLLTKRKLKQYDNNGN